MSEFHLTEREDEKTKKVNEENVTFRSHWSQSRNTFREGVHSILDDTEDCDAENDACQDQ